MNKAALALLFLVTLAVGQQPPPAPAEKPLIHFPAIVSPAPTPPPAPTPAPAGSALPLNAGTVFMFDADVPVFLRFFPASRANLVKVTTEDGPIGRVKMRFADKPDSPEVRTFAGKYVYTIEPAGIGIVDMVAVPSGLTKTADIQSQCFKVDDGSKPIPVPPDPEPPTPPGDALAKAIQAAYTNDADPAKAVNAPRLAFLYEDLARSTVDDPKIVLWNDFLKRLVDQRKALIGEGLASVRAVVDTEFKYKFPSPDKPIDVTGRVLAKSVLNHAAECLKGVK